MCKINSTQKNLIEVFNSLHQTKILRGTLHNIPDLGGQAL